jgi:hypothetical protein
MEEITFKIILPLAFIAMTILALHFWTLYLKYKKMYLEYKVKENEIKIKEQIYGSILKNKNKAIEIIKHYREAEIEAQQSKNELDFINRNKSICSFCGKTEREQMKGCNEITCYRQHL